MSIAAHIIEGLENATAHTKGEPHKGRVTTLEVPTVDVKALRAFG